MYSGFLLIMLLAEILAKAKAMLKYTKLLSLFKAVEDMNEVGKHIITELKSTFIFQRDTQKQLTRKQKPGCPGPWNPLPDGMP